MYPQQVKQSDRHQAKLLKAVLRIIIIFSVIIGSLNVSIFASYTVGSFNFITAFLSGTILLYFKRTKNLTASSWLTCLAVIFNIGVFIHLAEARNYSVLWVMVIPPIVFFLLGRRYGAWLTAGVFAYTIIMVAYQLQQPRQEIQGLGALFNIIEVCIALWFIYRFYEGSRQAAYSELEVLSATDKLTRLYNRSKLDQLLYETYQQLKQRQLETAVVVICDIDHFKSINDKFGHLEGDRVLQSLTHELHQQVGDKGMLGRWGGEEFMLILPNFNVAQASELCEQLRSTITRKTQTSKTPLTLSFGLALLDPANSIEHTLLLADRALYRAKQDGRDCVRIANAI